MNANDYYNIRNGGGGGQFGAPGGQTRGGGGFGAPPAGGTTQGAGGITAPSGGVTRGGGGFSTPTPAPGGAAVRPGGGITAPAGGATRGAGGVGGTVNSYLGGLLSGPNAQQNAAKVLQSAPPQVLQAGTQAALKVGGPGQVNKAMNAFFSPQVQRIPTQYGGGTGSQGGEAVGATSTIDGVAVNGQAFPGTPAPAGNWGATGVATPSPGPSLPGGSVGPQLPGGSIGPVGGGGSPSIRGAGGIGNPGAPAGGNSLMKPTGAPGVSVMSNYNPWEQQSFRRR